MTNIVNESSSESAVLLMLIWTWRAGLVIRDVAISTDQHNQRKETYDLSKDTLQENLEYGRWIREDSFYNLSFLADCTPNLLDESSHPRFRFGRWCIGVAYSFPSNYQHLTTGK